MMFKDVFMKRKTLSIILIIVGIAIMCIPFAGRFYTEYRQDKAYDEYLKQMEQEMSAMNDTFSEVSELTDAAVSEGGANPSVTSEAAIRKPSSIKGIIGRIKIPAISSDLLLLEGSSTNQLNWGAGHVLGTAMPGESGNCAIAAHRPYTFGSYFSRLGEVGIGNEIFVDYKGAVFKYRVNEVFTITPDEVWVLGTDGTPIITLITCHPKGSNSHRLIVRGALVTEGDQTGIPEQNPEEPLESTQPEETANPDNNEPAAQSMPDSMSKGISNPTTEENVTETGVSGE